MSLSSISEQVKAGGGQSRLALRSILFLAAVFSVVALLAFTGWFLSSEATSQGRTPFGAPLREASGNAGSLASFILAIQSRFYRDLTSALTVLQAGGAFWPLLILGFAYGVFHAAGPGHGKGVIAAYLVSDNRTLRRGILLSFAASLVQACVAIGLVGVSALLLKASAASMTSAIRWIEIATYGFMLGLGLLLAWNRAGRLVAAQGQACGPNCGHQNLVLPERISHLNDMRDMALVALAAGLRPCAGAIVLLVFAVSQKAIGAGLAGVFAMAFGTALTTAALSVLAVYAKRTALKVASGSGYGHIAMGLIELVACSFIAALGAILLTGTLKL